MSIDRYDPDHPDRLTLDLYLDNRLSDAESRAVVAHLTTLCEPCWSHLRGVHGRRRTFRPPAPADATPSGGNAGDGPPASSPTPYDAAFTSGLQRSAAGRAAVRGEELDAMSLWSVLEGTPPAQRQLLVRGDRRFLNHRIVLRLIDTAGELHWREAERGIEACRLALDIADRMPPAAALPAGLAHDLRARALSGLADMLRLHGELEAAARTMEAAWAALDEGTQEPLERAGLLVVAAKLQMSLGNFAGAADLLRPAASLFRKCGDPHREGGALQKLAVAVGHEDPAQGVVLGEQALALIDPVREPRLELAARHARIWFLNDSGRSWQALAALEDARPLYRQLADSQPRLALPWLEARICRNLGRLAAAERGLAAVWHEFREAGFHFDLTQVSLDLAETYLAQGKTRHAIRLLKVFLGTLRQWHVHTEGIAAWLLLTEAAAGEAARAQALAREVGIYFRRAWGRAVPFLAGGRGGDGQAGIGQRARHLCVVQNPFGSEARQAPPTPP